MRTVNTINADIFLKDKEANTEEFLKMFDSISQHWKRSVFLGLLEKIDNLEKQLDICEDCLSDCDMSGSYYRDYLEKIDKLRE